MAQGERHNAYLGLGSSVGDRLENLRAALRRLQEADGVRIVAVSSVYETPHLGLEPGDAHRYPPHLNCVAQIETSLAPEALLSVVQRVEAEGGRQRTLRWGPRTIDLDILVYDSVRMHSEMLTLPHPGIAERAFVMVPFAEIAPDLRLPDGSTLTQRMASEAIRAQKIERVATHELLL